MESGRANIIHAVRQRTEILSVVEGNQNLSVGLLDKWLRRKSQLKRKPSRYEGTYCLTAVIKDVHYPGSWCDVSIVVLEESGGNQTIEVPDSGGS